MLSSASLTLVAATSNESEGQHYLDTDLHLYVRVASVAARVTVFGLFVGRNIHLYAQVRWWSWCVTSRSVMLNVGF